MADTKKSVNFLPEYLQTDKNAKFLSSTIDQFIQTPQVERIEGYVGSKLTPNYDPNKDFYLANTSSLRSDYDLEPSAVFRDANGNVTDVVAFDDLLNEIKIQGGDTSNIDTIFRSKFYSFDPLIDWDKLVNFTDYYWLPLGPGIIEVSDVNLDVTQIIGAETYTLSNGYKLSNGMMLSFGDNPIQPAYRRKQYIVEGVGKSIKLIDFSLLSSFGSLAQVFNETFDSTIFDDYPFDSDKKLPVNPDYITVNRASPDLNPWSRYNRWFHKDIIKITAEINKVPVVYPLAARARRPIVEFVAGLQLYNFGSTGKAKVDLIDTVTTDALITVDGTNGYYVDGVLLEQGHRVIFNADTSVDVRGKIYEVNYDLTGDVPVLRLINPVDQLPNNLDSISVDLGLNYAGTDWWFDADSSTWNYAQQHSVLNQPPLFELFDRNGVSYRQGNEVNDFTGNRIFGYDVGTGSNDEVLGFPLKYQNSVGTGSYLFKTYFLSDSITLIDNNLSSSISTAVTFLKLNNELVNIWRAAPDYQIPIIEIQTLTESTNTLTLTCLDKPIQAPVSVDVLVNNVKVKTTTSYTPSSVTVTSTSTVFLKDQTVVLKVYANQTPNANGYFETPTGLTKNPLNGLITSLTLSELGDHLATMTSKAPNLNNVGLRDLSNFAQYGSRLVVNENPISFAHVFLGKKEHNVVDAIRLVGDHYNQFKMSLLSAITKVDSSLTARDALDQVLTLLNRSKDIKSLYQRSDMLGYGQDKVVRQYTILDPTNVNYPIGYEFDLTRLSFKSVIVYLNDVQLLNNTDYQFDYIDGGVTIIKSLTAGDKLEIHCYNNTLGCYVPPTPTKLGLYPASVPVIYQDDTFVGGPVSMIKGHDGSVIKAYGDYRDAIILEFEKRIFNNIKVSYNSQIFDVMAIQPGAFRSEYLNKNFTDIVINDFNKWAGLNSVNTFVNDTFDEGNSFTWNYQGAVDKLQNTPVHGYWRGIFRYFYDTDRPNIEPWRMLGFVEAPDWWYAKYGLPPYQSTNTLLWQDLEDGRINGVVNLDYARPGLSAVIPVDTNGDLKDPSEFLLTAVNYQDKLSQWKFSKFIPSSPAQNAWYSSSHWPFAVCAAAALLDPSNFCAKLYDVSRTSINPSGQISYLGDDLYLDPRKLAIEGEDNLQIAGYGSLVIERGRQRDQNYTAILRQDLEYLNFNLFHKLGGFASKEKLQIVIDSIDPTSTSPGVVLPSEDYSLILNVSNPIKTSRISGIIVQKSNGKFVVKGYDVANPYFNIFQPIKTAASGAVKIGGVSESFSDWSAGSGSTTKGLSSVDLTTAESVTTRYYKQGQIVRYNNVFYRVKVSHNAQNTFDPTLFQKLAELPVIGGVSAQLPSAYETTVTKIPYGTQLSTIQEVFDLIMGYGAWLESEGFIFDEFSTDLNEILNWRYSGKEFLYWTTQNWANNNLITLSPFANYIKYSYPNSVVDDVAGGKYEYSLLKADGKPFPLDQFTLAREDAVCTIKTSPDTEEGLFFAVLNCVQKEHGMVFNNYTMFNDTIYNPLTGYKQQRIKLSGFRTKNWNGDLFSPGFVFDDVYVEDWKPYTTYIPGRVVRYNGSYYEAAVFVSAASTFNFSEWVKLDSKPVSQLLPNFDYKINQFEDFYSLDIDNFDFGQQQLAQHLTGYTPRTYLNNIFTNPISQYKFYQGFIKEKGTKNAIDRLSKASQSINKGSVEFKEEWAFRVGHYGGYTSFNEIEFTLPEGTALENPYLVKFVDSVPNNANPLINFITPAHLLISPDEYVTSSTFISYPGSWNDTNLKLTTAGYVRPDDVTSTAYNKNSLLDIANNSDIQNGDTIWLGFLENGDWTVYRYTELSAQITGVFVSAPGSEITFVTNVHHNLQIGDIISIVRFNEQVNGVYIVTSIPELNQFSVASQLATIENEPLVNYGSLFKFNSVRYSDLSELAQVKELINFKAGDKVWIDQGTDNKWKVYQKIKNYENSIFDTVDTPPGQLFGTSIFAKDDCPVMMISSPGWKVDGTYSWGRVTVYDRFNNSWVKKYEYILNSLLKTYCDSTSTTQFGFSLQYDKAKELYFTGAPEASYVRSPLTNTGTVIISTGTGTIKSFINEGLVKISSRNPDVFEDITEVVLVNPYGSVSTLSNYARFGHSIHISQPSAAAATLLLVGAPGSDSYTGIGSVYAYAVTKNTSSVVVSAHPQGINLLSTSTVSLGANSQWGYKITGLDDGSLVAISAPGYSTDTGVVQLFNSNLQHIQTLASPFGINGRFGQDIVVSSTGKYIFVSAPETKAPGEPYGKIVVYSKTSGSLYSQYQIIENPLSTTDLKFGYSLSLSKDEKTLVIGALGKNRSKEQIFDSNLNVGETTFDNDSTTFYETLEDAGTVYLYNFIGDKFIQADELNEVGILSGSQYGFAVAATNNEVLVGAPSTQSNSLPLTTTDTSKVFVFDKIDTQSLSWTILRTQEDLVEASTLSRVALIDNVKEEIIDYLDVVDPLKGKIVGLAEQELKYKAAFDPAIYSIGLAGVIVDTEINWLDEHVGELWWDLSTAKYMWYEQGDEIFRKNNWGRLFPGASIDVYEWVKSDLLPSEWAAQADTNEGLTRGISGQPKYPDNSIISVKQVYNNVTGAFENVYYFWVKNKVTLPNAKNRRLNSFQVASYIADPVANGLKFIELLSPNAVAFANVQNVLVGDRVNANLAIDKNANIPRHTEWLLLTEGDPNSVPNTLLEKKLFDSLLGRDSLGNLVPDPKLTYRNRYGIGIRPQQTLFKNRSEALRNLFGFVNSVLLENRVVGSFSLEGLTQQEEISSLNLNEYDSIVEDIDALNEIITLNYARAKIKLTATNGKITGAEIINPGFNYGVAPSIKIDSDSEIPAEILSEIDALGRVVSVRINNPGFGYADGIIPSTVREHSVIVRADSNFNNKWTKYGFNYNTRTWVKTKTQTFNTNVFWKYVDWSSTDFDSYKTFRYTIPSLFEIGSVVDIQNNDYIKVKNIGDGRYAILRYTTGAGNYIPSYDIVYREQGTIQFLETLWNYTTGSYSYDVATLEETLYDQIPDKELVYIFDSLKNNIFIKELKVYWNKFFFAAVKFALTEQKLLDWAFKTSFINVQNSLGDLEQRPVYKLTNEQYFEDYIKEVKPYHTKIRNYVSAYTKLENADIYTTDFDLPSYYNTLTNALDVIELGNPLLDSYPWKSWKDNYKFYLKEIKVGIPGSGYSERPVVTITTATGDSGYGAKAEAYIRNGSVYRVLVTDPGQNYVIPPIVTITGGGTSVTEQARVSVIMDNDEVRKNLIGIKFDRTSLEGDLTDLYVTEEFVCDGNTDKFTLSWLAEPDKKTIEPLVNGKLVFADDYTIEFYQIKLTNDGLDIAKAFPKLSWEGERAVDRRYKYFNQDSETAPPTYIKHYAKFVFKDRVPADGDIFKITYKKNIDLYNAIDRITSLYNPTDLMPGKELPLLISGAEYPGTQITGLLFSQNPQWDSTGTAFDSAPWGEYVSNYTRTKLVTSSPSGQAIINVESVDGIFLGQSISIVGTTEKYFQDDTVVVEVNQFDNSVTVGTLEDKATKIKQVYSTSTSANSLVTVECKTSFHTALNAGDLVKISGVNSLQGYGLQNYSIQTTVVSSGSVTVQLPAPDVAGGRQATAIAIKRGGTVNPNEVIAIQFTDRGMGYTNQFGYDAGLVTGNPSNTGTVKVFLDAGYNQSVTVTDVLSDKIFQFRLPIDVSSTTTTVTSAAFFDLVSIIKDIPRSSTLLETYTESFVNSPVASIGTFVANLPDSSYVVKARLSNTTTTIASTSTNTLWYSVVAAENNPGRYNVEIRDSNTGSNITGEIILQIYGPTEIEFFGYNSESSLIDSAISGSTLYDTTLGYKPEDIVIDGNNFLNPIDSYAPEECVPGHVRDSLGISVYTAATPSYPLVISGAFGVQAGVQTSAKLSLVPDTPAGFEVYGYGIKFERVDTVFNFTTNTQYAIEGDTVVVPPQPVTGKIGYSFVTVGSNVVTDSDFVYVDLDPTLNTVTVSSLLNIEDVRSVYVLVNGNEISETTTSTQYGYRLEPVGSNNNRASVKIYQVNSRVTVQAWFFTATYTKFNRVYEQFVTIGSTPQSQIVFDRPVQTIEPISEQIIVEKIVGPQKIRLLPPSASYYKVVGTNRTFAIDSKVSRPGFYSLDNVKVYLNGLELRPGYDFSVNSVAETITLLPPTVKENDVVAITAITDYEYLADKNNLVLATPVNNCVIKITSFTDHDNMLIRTERFVAKALRRFTLSGRIINENYVWVTVNNKALIPGYDFRIADDERSIEITEYFDVGQNDQVVITTINPPTFGASILGFKIFKDMFDRQHFTRISKYFSTRLAEPLDYTSSAVILEDGDHLLQPNPAINLPGVVYIDGERIEYRSKNGNVLNDLRRSTLGTGPALFSDVGTLVIDESARQTIPTEYYSVIQNIPSSNTNTYIINANVQEVALATEQSEYIATESGSGISIDTTTTYGTTASGIIIFSTLAAAEHQVEVYFGGRLLRKTPLQVHNKSVSYYDTPDSITTLPPEFTINASTMELILNIDEVITTGTQITIVKKEGKLWQDTGSTSLLTSNSPQAEFLRNRPAELPDIYYYGGEKLLLDNTNTLTDENDEPLEGY